MKDQIDETAASISTLSIIENISQLNTNWHQLLFSKRSWKKKTLKKKKLRFLKNLDYHHFLSLCPVN